MPNDPFNQVYCERNQGSLNDLSDYALSIIETSDEWSEWRKNIAEQMYIDNVGIESNLSVYDGVCALIFLLYIE